MAMAGGVAVNTRSLGRHMSGVERYTSELTRHLGRRLRPLKPDRPVSPLTGQLWEQGGVCMIFSGFMVRQEPVL